MEFHPYWEKNNNRLLSCFFSSSRLRIVLTSLACRSDTFCNADVAAMLVVDNCAMMFLDASVGTVVVVVVVFPPVVRLVADAADEVFRSVGTSVAVDAVRSVGLYM